MLSGVAQDENINGPEEPSDLEGCFDNVKDFCELVYNDEVKLHNATTALAKYCLGDEPFPKPASQY